MDKRRSRPVRPAVRCALAGVMATVAVSSAWQVVSAKSTTAVASAARGHLKARHHHAVATEADNMKSVTLRRGDTLTVTLHGGWSTPTSSDQKVMRDSGMKPMFVCPPNAMRPRAPGKRDRLAKAGAASAATENVVLKSK